MNKNAEEEIAKIQEALKATGILLSTETLHTFKELEEKHRHESGHFRFHLPYVHLSSTFGNDWFALKAEAFARFFGTPVFLILQTSIVAVWLFANIFGYAKFDLYPFILLNLAFSLQAAYAAPLILLAQTRQADRDKAHLDADAQHRESIARASEERGLIAAKQTLQLIELMKQNTNLTETTQELSKRIEMLTVELHNKMMETK